MVPEARLRKPEEPEQTTSIIRGRSGERPVRHPHFGDDPIVHRPVVGSPQSTYFPPDGDQLTSPGGTETEMGSEPYNPRFQERGEGSSGSGPSVTTSVGSAGGGPTPLETYVRPVTPSPEREIDRAVRAMQAAAA